jgi:thymidylate synthase (FAD)
MINEKNELKGFTINVLDDIGYVRLVDWLGDDSRIVEAARVSYASPSKGKEADDKLLHYLYRKKHTSPMEQCNISFNIKMPIFTMRQFVRHRTFKLNEQSARYSELPSDFYIPKSWRKQDTVNKQGSIDTGDWNPILDEGWESTATSALNDYCTDSYAIYQLMIKQGIAKEMARMILPVNVYTEIYVNCDLHNLLHFLTLRMDEHAQWEIRQYANAMYEITKKLFPVTIGAFDRYKWHVVDTREKQNVAELFGVK